MSTFALVNHKLFYQDQWRHDMAVLVDKTHIKSVIPVNDLPSTVKQIDAENCYLSPGFIDLQVNGGGGVMLNSAPSVDTLKQIQQGHWTGGTTAMLPTLITAQDEIMQSATEAMKTALDENIPGFLGLHLEGPHLNTHKKGVHNENLIRPLHQHTLDLLNQLSPNNWLITLAPEQLAPGQLNDLIKKGIRVNAGHSAANYQQTKQALSEGLSGFTHLFNAMTGMDSREPGMVGAALEDHHSACGIIIDGYHIHSASALIAYRSKAKGKLYLVTDAMATVGSDKPYFELYGEKIHSKNGCCAKEDGTLAGSALDMISAVKNCVNELNIPLNEAIDMASLYPAAFMGIDHQYGKIAENYRADFALFDDTFAVKSTWVQGQCVYQTK